jgi:hypothetical protein
MTSSVFVFCGSWPFNGIIEFRHGLIGLKESKVRLSP